MAPKKLLGSWAPLKVTAVPDGTFCGWGGDGDGFIKSSLLSLFLPRLVGGFTVLPVSNVGQISTGPQREARNKTLPLYFTESEMPPSCKVHQYSICTKRERKKKQCQINCDIGSKMRPVLKILKHENTQS